ncbi:MAG: efflux RND transporter periplasmic adaptor subunit [Gammaproteobacteria bacterium]|nr:efflux RND transporter periplasmic adaptor subunit [Gammaproteobacteria bacterium]MDP2139915.1 efflux RND transporter periplasmic adaptor subunit [Gammaproteobacteria bacterium]MDP2347735.1 efflux RND transporter periplasmic adaptor subunit [Gammaproteobacteria bacterium]
MKRIILPVAILVGAFLVFTFLVRNPERLEAVAPEQALATVRVATVQPQSVTLTVSSQGKVQASRRVSLSAAATGPVSWISPALVAGGYFAADDVILRLDASDYMNAVARSQTSLEQAETEARHSASELERYRELAARRLISDSQLQDLQRQADISAGRVRDAQAALSQSQLDMRRSEIRAPFASIVESTSIELGQHVNRGQELATLLSADDVEVRLPLALTQLGYLDIPLGFRGELPADIAPDVTLRGMFGGQMHTWIGRLVRTEAGIDTTNNAVQAIVRVEQSTAQGANGEEVTAIPLPVGLYIEASISGKTVNNIFALPREVIRGNSQVLVVDAENKMYFRDVEILRLENERVLIQSGLRAGERICMSPIQAVVNGMSVQVIEE